MSSTGSYSCIRSCFLLLIQLFPAIPSLSKPLVRASEPCPTRLWHTRRSRIQKSKCGSSSSERLLAQRNPSQIMNGMWMYSFLLLCIGSLINSVFVLICTYVSCLLHMFHLSMDSLLQVSKPIGLLRKIKIFPTLSVFFLKETWQFSDLNCFAVIELSAALNRQWNVLKKQFKM